MSLGESCFGSAYASAYDSFYVDKDYDLECDLVEEALRRFGETSTRQVLDLGCGTGGHAVRLAQRGFSVTGVDRSAGMLDIARRKALEAGVEGVEFLEGDVRRLELGQQFDAVVMLFAVLGYQVTNEDLRAALDGCRRYLRPGGVFVFDVWYGPAVLTIGPSERVKVVDTAQGQILRVANSTLDTRHHLCRVDYTIWRAHDNRPVVKTEERHTMRYYFPLELELALEDAGMRLESLSAFPSLDDELTESTWNALGVAV